MPTDFFEVGVEREESVVLATVGTDFNELTAVLHVVETVGRCATQTKRKKLTLTLQPGCINCLQVVMKLTLCGCN